MAAFPRGGVWTKAPPKKRGLPRMDAGYYIYLTCTYLKKSVEALISSRTEVTRICELYDVGGRNLNLDSLQGW